MSPFQLSLPVSPGLDPSGYRQSVRAEEEEEEDLVTLQLTIEERFRDCERFTFNCPAPTCGRQVVLDAPFTGNVSECLLCLFPTKPPVWIQVVINTYSTSAVLEGKILNLHHNFYNNLSYLQFIINPYDVYIKLGVIECVSEYT